MTLSHPTRRSTTTRRTRGAVVALALALGLTGCSTSTNQGGTTPEDVIDQGYISGDGSVRIWTAAERGEPVALAGTDFSGKAVDTSDWLGEIVVVNTWYAACPPCRAEAPVLRALAVDRADEGIHVVGLNKTDAAGAAQAFERTYEVPYPSINDSTGEVTAVLQGVVPVQATPTTIVIDREGRVAARVLGLLSAATIKTIINDVLSESGGAASPTPQASS